MRLRVEERSEAESLGHGVELVQTTVAIVVVVPSMVVYTGSISEKI